MLEIKKSISHILEYQNSAAKFLFIYNTLNDLQPISYGYHFESII